MTIKNKEKLNQLIRDLLDGGVVLAFSGGVDSSLLLKLFSTYRKNPNDLVAITFNTALSPRDDLDITKNQAKEMDVELYIEDTDEILDENIINNRVDRCYHCKKSLFSQAIALRDKLGYKYVVDGSNLDDFQVYRPGIKALIDSGVISPLFEAGFTKKMVRDYAKELGLEVHRRPSTPCLATRFPYDRPIDFSKFEMLEEAEAYLKEMGFDINRVRLYDQVTRIEIEKSKFMQFFELSDKIVEKFKSIGFKYVNLDMEGFRSGSMDEVVDEEIKKKFRPN